MAARKKPPAPKRGRGRPTRYTPELGRELANVIAGCTTPIFELCETDDRFPSWSTWYDWKAAHPEFAALCSRAKRIRGARHMQKALDAVEGADASKGYGVGSANVRKSEAIARVHERIAAATDPETWSEKRRHDVNAPGLEGALASFVDIAKSARGA